MADLDPAPLRTCGELFSRIILQRRSLIQAQSQEECSRGYRLRHRDSCLWIIAEPCPFPERIDDRSKGILSADFCRGRISE